MESYGQECVRPAGEYTEIPRVTEEPCRTVTITRPSTHNVAHFCPGKPDFTQTTMTFNKKHHPMPISVIPRESGVNVTGNKLWQMPIQLENVTEPEQIHVKVHLIFRTLQISRKPTVTDFITGTRKTGKVGANVFFKRILPLPENIDLNQLKWVISSEGILHLEAPFLIDNSWEREGCCSAPCPGMTLQEQCNTDLSLLRYLRLLKTVTLSHGAENHVECVKDSTIGAWTIHLNMDTLGYEPRNYQVLFHGKGRRLAVIGKRHLPGFGSNVFQREFHVPEYLDVNQMQWRVMNNGLVRIEMPCQGGKIPMEGKFMRNIPCTDY